jgi:arylsulfatase A-like enzyme/Tfp pilus assembly protein PilF
MALALGLASALVFSRRGAIVHGEAGLNVLLVTIDTLRSDALGCYGRAGAETPRINALAAGGVRFETAHAHNVVTLASHANILSGRLPFEHGIRDNAGYRFPARMETLATLLKARGYRTGAFVSGFPLDSRFGLDRGFDVYDDRFGDPEANPVFHMQERPGPETVAAARRFLDKPSSAPSFVWVHLYEPHAPYEPPEPWASRFAQEPYEGEVAAADAALAPLLDPLLAAGRDGRTLVVLTADHGESLGEHGEPTHGIFAYEATLRVPLIVYCPRLLPPRVVSEPVRHIDVLPTVLEAIGIAAPAGAPGHSLLPLAAGGHAVTPPSYFESLSPAVTRGWAPLRGVIDGARKYIELPIPELYDLAADPKEMQNLAASQPQGLESLQRLLVSMAGAGHEATAPQTESAEVRERLRALGYTSGAAPSGADGHYTVEDDPKRLIGLDAALQDVLNLYRAGHLEQAKAICASLIAQRPTLRLAHLHLAYLSRQQGDLEGALRSARRAFALDPSNAETAAVLANYLNESGRSAEVVQLLEPFARSEMPDLDILMALGAAQAKTGHTAEGLATLERARRLDPSNAMALVNVATVHLMTRDYDKARAAFEGALVLEPRLARAHNSLGVIEAETGHLPLAVEHWKKAVELNPGDLEALYNLGTALAKLGLSAEARPYLLRFAGEAPPAVYGGDIARIRQWLQRGGAGRR